MKKKFWGPKFDPKLGFLSLVASLVFLDIAQDWSLGQCLRPSRDETSKKKKKKKKNFGPNWAEMIFSNLMLLSVHSNLLKS